MQTLLRLGAKPGNAARVRIVSLRVRSVSAGPMTVKRQSGGDVGGAETCARCYSSMLGYMARSEECLG